MSNWTTFQIDKQTHKDLRIIAEVKERSMAGQVRFMVQREKEILKENGFLKSQDIEEEDDASSI